MATSCGDVDSDVDIDIDRRNREATSGDDMDDEVKGSVDYHVDDDVDVKVHDDVSCHVRRPHRLLKLDGAVGWRVGLRLIEATWHLVDDVGYI